MPANLEGTCWAPQRDRPGTYETTLANICAHPPMRAETEETNEKVISGELWYKLPPSQEEGEPLPFCFQPLESSIRETVLPNQEK